jgi:hypothetical protein
LFLTNRGVSTISSQNPWPLALLLDEIWLKVHRNIIYKFEEIGVWVDIKTLSQFMQQQKLQGEELKHDLLQGVLGEDYVLLGSEAVFGRSNRHFRIRLPYSLSFGYGLGTCFYELFKGEEEWKSEVARLSSLFNLGISIFDLIIDCFPDLFYHIIDIFNEKSLKQMINDPSTLKTIESHNASLSKRELRILLRLVIGFFKNLKKISEKSGVSRDSKHIFSTLLDAYKAEIQSQNFTDLTFVEQLKVSQTKSTLPFKVIEKLIQPYSENSSQLVSNSLHSLISHLSQSFWLIDDLADLINDARTGSLNSIFVRVRSCLGTNNVGKPNYTELNELITSNYIEETVNELCDHILTCVKILQKNIFDRKVAEQFQRFYFAYIQDWMM